MINFTNYLFPSAQPFTKLLATVSFLIALDPFKSNLLAELATTSYSKTSSVATKQSTLSNSSLKLVTASISSILKSSLKLVITSASSVVTGLANLSALHNALVTLSSVLLSNSVQPTLLNKTVTLNVTIVLLLKACVVYYRVVAFL